MKDWGESVSGLVIGKKTIKRNCTQYCLAWVFVPFVHVVRGLLEKYPTFFFMRTPDGL